MPGVFNFFIIAAVKTESFSPALFWLPGKLCEFNNIGSLTGIFHVTNLSVQNALNCSSLNFDILKSLYTTLLFSLLSTVNLFNLNRFVRINIFNPKAWAKNWFWKASVSSWCFKGLKSSSTSGMLSYSLMISDSS